MKNTGRILKEERERKKLSLHEIGMSLKINPKTLQALEEGNLTKLPAKSFLRGFVKSYAKYLKLNENEILESFHKEMFDLAEGEKVATSDKPTAPVDQRASVFDQASQVGKAASLKKSEPRPPLDANQETLFANKIFVGSGVVVLVFMIVITAKLFDKYQKERQIDKVQIENVQATDMKALDSAATATPDATGTDAKGATPTLTNEAKELADAAPVTTAVDSPAEEVKPKIGAKEESKKDEKKADVPTATTAVKTPNPTPGPTPTVAPTSAITATTRPTTAVAAASPSIAAKKADSKKETQDKKKSAPPNQTSSGGLVNTKELSAKDAALKSPAAKPLPGLPKNPTEVIVEALNKVQIKYSLGDGKTQTLELNPDQVHTFKSKSFVEIEISDGGSVSLIVNGRERGVPGSIGKPVKLTYPKL